MFFRLVERADVVVENFRPGVKYRLGIEPDAVWAVNRRVVYASISGFGQSGPYADRPGVDQIAQGLGGLMSVTGPPGSGPWRVGIAVSDTAAGTLLTQGVLAALIARDRTGRGQWVHTSLLEAMVSFMDFQAARWLIDGEVPGQEGNQHPTMVPMGAYPTADGYLNVSALRDFGAFCALLGEPALADDPRYADLASRLAHRAELDADIARLLRTRTTTEWVERLADIGAVRTGAHRRRGVRRPPGGAPAPDPAGRAPDARRHRRAPSAADVQRHPGAHPLRSAGRRRAHARGARRARVRRGRDRRAARQWRGREPRLPSTGARGMTAIDTGTDKMLAHVEDGIGWMTYNNPARLNAMSYDMQIAVPRILGAFAEDPEVHVIVVRGAGDRAFVSGADISEFSEKRTTVAARADYDEALARAWGSWRLPPGRQLRGQPVCGGNREPGETGDLGQRMLVALGEGQQDGGDLAGDRSTRFGGVAGHVITPLRRGARDRRVAR